MTKLRFIICSIVVLMITTFSIVTSGNSLALYTSISSLVIAILLPYIIVSFIFSPSEQIKMNNEIFKPVGNGDKKLLTSALVYLQSLKKLLIYSGVLSTFMGLIAMGANLEDPEALGPNFAVLLIVPLYVALFLLIVIEPLRASAEKNLLA